MRKVKNLIQRFVRDERGLETVEYAVIAGLITVAAIATIAAVGLLVNDKFGELEEKLSE